MHLPLLSGTILRRTYGGWARGHAFARARSAGQPIGFRLLVSEKQRMRDFPALPYPWQQTAWQRLGAQPEQHQGVRHLARLALRPQASPGGLLPRIRQGPQLTQASAVVMRW